MEAIMHRTVTTPFLIALVIFCLFISKSKAASSENQTLPEKASYQVRCRIDQNGQYSSFAVASATAISPHFLVSCGHLFDDMPENLFKTCEVLLPENGNKWTPVKVVRYTNWKKTGDIDLSLFFLPEIEFPDYCEPAIIDLSQIEKLQFVGFGSKNIKHLEEITIKSFRAGYQNLKPDILTSYVNEHGDSGGGIFYNNKLVAVTKCKVNSEGKDIGSGASTNAQLINFLYPSSRNGDTDIKTDCYIYGGRQYCTPVPQVIIPKRNIVIGPVQNVYPTKTVPSTIQPNKKEEAFISPIKTDDICKPFKDQITKLENDLEQVKSQLSSQKNVSTTQINFLNGEKDRLFKEKQAAELELIKAKRFVIYFTLEGDINCQETDTQVARIREKGLNVVTVVMKRQDVAVNSVPRLFLMPERRTIYGKADCLTYLQSIN
jgi:hypothetical protein